MMLPQLIGAIVASQTEVGVAPAPLLAPPWVFGVGIFATMVVLLFICVSFTNLGNRHEPVDEHSDPHRQHTNKHDNGEGQSHH
jgi:hypothetical protein